MGYLSDVLTTIVDGDSNSQVDELLPWAYGAKLWPENTAYGGWALGDWYSVPVGRQRATWHYTWVRFDEDAGDRRYVQVKSCDSFPAAEAFIKSSPVPLAAHLTAKKWFAIAVKGTYVEEEAKDVSNALKEHGLIAKDSIVTLGNTYVRRVCCQWLRLVPIAFAMLAWCRAAGAFGWILRSVVMRSLQGRTPSCSSLLLRNRKPEIEEFRAHLLQYDPECERVGMLWYLRGGLTTFSITLR